MENQTQIIENTTGQNSVAPTSKTAEQIAANTAKVTAALDSMEREANTAYWRDTAKGNPGFDLQGKTVAGMILRMRKTEKLVFSVILNELRNSANYVDGLPSEKISKWISKGSIAYHTRTMSKKYDCQFTAVDVYRAVMRISDAMFRNFRAK